MVNGDDLRRKPYAERKATLRKLLRYGRGIQYVEHAEGHGDKLFEAACNLGLEGIVSKKLDAPYRSGPSKTWIKVKNPKSPAATRAIDGTSEAVGDSVINNETESCAVSQTHTDCKID